MRLSAMAVESWLNKADVDLSQPLHHYWIMSSHNTYLTGIQYTAFNNESSGVGYTQALDKSSRFLETDLWCPNKLASSKKELEVFHGANDIPLTPKIEFQAVLDAINNWHKENENHTPIILTIENHCKDHDMLKTAADMFNTTFGRALLTKKEAKTAIEKDTFTPKNLKNTILVRAKKTEVTEWNNILVIGKSHNWSDPSPRNVRSMTVSSFHKESKHGGTDVLKINQKMMTRVYNDGHKQILSQNFNPLPMWGLGVQVVALNLQTFDQQYVVNRGMFQQKGDGYVLKPGKGQRGTLKVEIIKKEIEESDDIKILLLNMERGAQFKSYSDTASCDVSDDQISMLVLLHEKDGNLKAGNAARVSELNTSGELVTVDLTNEKEETQSTLTLKLNWTASAGAIPPSVNDSIDA